MSRRPSQFLRRVPQLDESSRLADPTPVQLDLVDHQPEADGRALAMSARPDGVGDADRPGASGFTHDADGGWLVSTEDRAVERAPGREGGTRGRQGGLCVVLGGHWRGSGAIGRPICRGCRAVTLRESANVLGAVETRDTTQTVKSVIVIEFL